MSATSFQGAAPKSRGNIFCSGGGGVVNIVQNSLFSSQVVRRNAPTHFWTDKRPEYHNKASTSSCALSQVEVSD